MVLLSVDKLSAVAWLLSAEGFELSDEFRLSSLLVELVVEFSAVVVVDPFSAVSDLLVLVSEVVLLVESRLFELSGELLTDSLWVFDERPSAIELRESNVRCNCVLSAIAVVGSSMVAPAIVPIVAIAFN